ncbi:Stromal membrane-associated protein [Pleurostoma richardsiae]|uniref:Stromal membrane-associated protein n=1 Tax=Pleurostoma richardsiae TaxID=41990 RepID=A0AA38RMW5_9PEZI|nr:Stromal membrane-associated protein [Pleurostoma richardsiae]
MSRRPPNPAAERAAKNQATIKSLLKLEPNKICADCKRNKHPRWASWNLGVFICIRCSGIHRGMGTHISRVKSVDLDSWTDEQLQSILSWGNARANKYWEAKLAPGHVPSEAKIENFIRTKYELKRWVMDGPMPDPATLDVDGDDDVPLSVVKEKQNIDRRESVRKASLGQSSAPAPPPQADLIGGDPVRPPRASTTGPIAGTVPPKAAPAPPKASSSTKDSLLGLDFLGEPAPPPRPASTTGAGGTGGTSRPDLKQSILSLYATAPRPQPQQPQHASHASSGSFGGMQSPGLPSLGQQPQAPVGGLNDAFSGLSFSSSTAPKSPQTSAFSNLGGLSGSRSPPQPSSSSAFSGLSGGSFFDAKPTPTTSSHQSKQSFGSSGGFGAFTSPSPPAAPKPSAAPASASLGDLFDFSGPALASQPAAPAASNPAPAPSVSSVFNLSSNQQKQSPPAAAAASTSATTTSNSLGSFGGLSGADVWGGNAWAAPEPEAKPTPKSPGLAKTNDFGWGTSSLADTPIVPGASGGFAAAPKVAADEEFGGWTSSIAGGNSGSGTGTKPAGGLGTSEDLFSNVWQ